MTFLTVSPTKEILNELTKVIFEVSPGSVIYEFSNAAAAFYCAKTHHIDRVFIDGEWDGKQEFNMLIQMREAFEQLPVFVLGSDDEQEETALWNEATGYISYPVTKDKLRVAIEDDGQDCIR